MEWSTIGLISYVLLWVVVIFQVVLTLTLARLVGQLMSRRFPGSGARVMDPGPEIGSAVEDWEGVDLLGRAVCVQFPRDRGLFLLFISPHCTACAWLLPSAKRFFKEIAVQTEGAWVLLGGSEESQLHYAKENGLLAHPVLAESRIPPSWRAGGGPFGLWVDATGRVRTKGMVNSREHLESLRYAVEVGHPSVESYLSALSEEQERERSSEPSEGSAVKETMQDRRPTLATAAESRKEDNHEPNPELARPDGAGILPMA
jgi:methylamine dehydrogenase accessory protein MauD